MSVFHLVFFRCHSVSPKWGFHKRFRCPITLPNRLAQLDVLLLCNHIVHYIRLSFRFQSPLPRGERPVRVMPVAPHQPISIRAPARGATAAGMFRIFTPLFQSALPRGERQDGRRLHESSDPISIRAPARGATHRKLHRCNRKEFQSALPRGERPVSICSCHTMIYFNPRSREGSDPRYFRR